jgi:phage recombination protein Bet
MKRKANTQGVTLKEQSEPITLKSDVTPLAKVDPSDRCSISQNKQISLIERLIKKEANQCAKQIGINEDELQAWIDQQIDTYKSISSKNILQLLRTAKEHQLDPMQEEVLLAQYEDRWQIIISIDGWIKLINRHPAFTGISFEQSSEEKEGLPIWMGCTITRSDRTMPITAREYLAEVRNDSDYWKKMPRRMLRHKAMQQCARIALAITVSEGPVEISSSKISCAILNEASLDSKQSPQQTQTEKLKSLLVKSS